MRLLGNAASAQRVDQLRTARPVRAGAHVRRPRGSYTRHALAATDLAGLFVAFVLSTAAFVNRGGVGDHVRLRIEVCLFLLTLPLWLMFARVLGLYDRHDARGWSIGLDLSLIMRTPFALLRQRSSTR